ncbi:hypothetical protein [Clostridium perfringens]|uniref:hypothetical protein n=1 Tax=Clostridium perfringens TaxID=1502 RepID=UPI0032DA2E4F
MNKVNPYFELIDNYNKNVINELKTLSNETLDSMNECKLLYSKQGQQIKINQIYQEAISKAQQIKNSHVQSLKALLEQEKVKLQPKPITDVNERILNELIKLNKYNSFSTQLAYMSTDEILRYENENYLNEQEVSLIKSELTKRADNMSGEEGLNLLQKQRQLSYIPKAMLLQQAYERIEQYELDSNMFPGMSVSDSLTGGVEKLLGKDILDEVNEVNFFGGNE